MWSLGLSYDDIIRLDTLSKCFRWRCSRNCVGFGLDNCWNLQFNPRVLPLSVTCGVRHVSPSLFWQLFNPHLLLLTSLHAVLNDFGDCAYRPAWFVICSQLPQHLILFIFFLRFPTLLIGGSCKISRIAFDSIVYLLICVVMLSGCRSHLFSSSHISQRIYNCCLWILNSLSCNSSLSIQMILN